MPDSIKEIGVNAFTNTRYYKDDMNWESGVLYIDNHLIKAKTDLSSEYCIKDGTITIANMAFDNCTNLTSIILPDSVENIGKEAFDRCSSLSALQMSENIKRIGSWAFGYMGACSKLSEIWLPDHVIEIDSTSFRKTKYAQLPENWENGELYIGNHLVDFDMYASFCEVNNGTIDIASAVFEDCSDLEELKIPASVKRIGAYLTYNCYKLKTIYFAGTEAQWNYIVAEPNDDLATHAVIFGQVDEHECCDSDGDGLCDLCHKECSSQEDYLQGDINGDGKVNVADVSKVYAHIRGTSILIDEHTIARCDVTGDGKINVADVSKIYAYVRGTIKELSPSHTHSYTKTSTVNPTCTEKGYSQYTCSCGMNYSGDYMVALGHNWTLASCENPKKCSTCGLTEGTVLPHDMSEATCTSVPTCKVCGYQDGDFAFHNFKRSPTDCTKDICTECGEMWHNGNDHDFWFTSCTTPSECQNCGTTNGNIPGHRFKNGKCTMCGTNEGD